MRIVRGSVLLLLIFASANLFAGTISGKLVDSKSNEKIDYANVALFKSGSTVPVKGVSSAEDGSFRLQDLSLGKYLLKISFVGYSPIELPIALNNKRSDIDLGSIRLEEDSKKLGEVNVTGQKSQMRFELDRKVFNVDQNIAAAGASASEILKNIPSVEVDVQGNVSLRNNSNVIIWINGRPSGLNEDNRAQVLEQMPAETIERVEVITNPSSKYSPEGSAGIINIVLKKDRKAGYYGSVSGGADTFNGTNGSVNINYNSKKWDLYANVGYRNNTMDMTGSTNRNNWNSDLTKLYNLQSSTNGSFGMGGFFSRFGAAYHLTEKDLIGTNLMINRFKRNSDTQIDYKSTLNFVEDTPYSRFATNDGNFNMSSLSMDYTHTFDKPGHELKGSVEYNKMQIDFNNHVTQSNQLSNEQLMDLNGGRKEWEVQVDYTYPINKVSKIEAGFKGEYNDRSSTTIANAVNNIEPDFALNNEFDSGEDRNSLYLNYSNKVNKMSYQLGLRGEYNLMKNTSYTYDSNKNQTVTPFNKEYPGLYPSLFINYELPKNNELQLNYTRRINRPHGRTMNPYRDISDSTNISFGNPQLNPEYSNSLELNHIKTWENHTLSSSIYYRTTSDVIQQVNYIQDNIKYSTSVNITNTKAAGFEFILKDRFFKFIDLTSTLNLYYSKLDPFNYIQTQYAGSESFAWTARTILNMGLPKGWMLQLTGGYQSKKTIAQGEVLPDWGADAGIRKMFFNRKLSLNLMARDIFNSRESRINSFGNNYTDYTKSIMGGRMVGFSLTYNFGNNTAQKKKQEVKRNDQNGNSDMMNGGDF
ncbi:MAG: TonB-dependent receptor [Bacteroidales bacterium]|nr:TonB-dependent receptor [Bacteroidales bacterium]